jgi:hypothetical protein
VFYQILEEVKIIKIVTPCKIVKHRKFKNKNYFKIPNAFQDINWFTIKKSPCILNSLSQLTNNNCTMGGDFNAFHPAWGSVSPLEEVI